MDPINTNSLNLSLSPEGALTHLLEFLESLQEIEEKPGSSIASSLFQQVSPGSVKGGETMKFSHQVQLLKILQKTKTELDELLEKMEGNEVSKNDLSQTKNDPNPSHKEEGLAFSAKTLDRKAFEVLLKREKIFSPFTASLEKEKKNGDLAASVLKSEPENLEKEAKETRLSSAFRTLMAFLDARNVERIPTAELIQKMKPFLDHLIVVVETQENMSKPSQKLTQLVRHLAGSSSFLKELSWSSLFKADPSEIKKGEEALSQGKQISKSKESSFEKAKNAYENPSSQILFSTQGSKSLASPQPIKELFPEEAKEQAQRLSPKEITPWAAPYSAQKLGARSRFKDKKKEKGPFRRKEKEDPEADRS